MLEYILIFLGVRGFLDGTHIEIQKPSKNVTDCPEFFFNRKGFHSLNVLIYCDHKRKVRFFVSSYAGSVHDSRIYRESALKTHLLESFNPQCPKFVLADEAYAAGNDLLPPFRYFSVLNRAHQFYYLVSAGKNSISK